MFQILRQTLQGTLMFVLLLVMIFQTTSVKSYAQNEKMQFLIFSHSRLHAVLSLLQMLLLGRKHSLRLMLWFAGYYVQQDLTLGIFLKVCYSIIIIRRTIQVMLLHLHFDLTGVTNPYVAFKHQQNNYID